MKRELAGMTEAQVLEWKRERLQELTDAYTRDHLSINMYNILFQWINESVTTWYVARAMNFIGEGA